MITRTAWDATKAGLLIAGLAFLADNVMADETDGIADRLDNRGCHIKRRPSQ